MLSSAVLHVKEENLYHNVKGKANLIQAWTGLEGSRRLRFLEISRQLAQEVVRL
jgi:hypothetical protein